MHFNRVKGGLHPPLRRAEQKIARDNGRLRCLLGRAAARSQTAVVGTQQHKLFLLPAQVSSVGRIYPLLSLLLARDTLQGLLVRVEIFAGKPIQIPAVIGHSPALICQTH